MCSVSLCDAMIFELLQAYLRAGDIDYGDEQPPIDVQEIVELLRNKLGEP